MSESDDDTRTLASKNPTPMLDFLSTTKTSGDDVDDARDIDEARHMHATATAEQHNNFDKPEKVTLNFMSLMNI